MVSDIVAQAHIVGSNGDTNEGTTSNAVTQSESDVPGWPRLTRPQIPPTGPPLQTNSGVHVPLSELVGKLYQLQHMGPSGGTAPTQSRQRVQTGIYQWT